MPARVLIAEDNRASLELFEYLLQAGGYGTACARDGSEAVELARAFQPDLVICDLQMPILNGFEVIRALKAIPALERIPVIAVTAFSMAGDREKALAAGFDAHISKPIDPETFVSEIESFLRKELRAGASAANAQSQHGENPSR